MKIAYAGIDLMCSLLETLVDKSNEIIKIFTCPCDNVTEFNTKIIDIADKNAIPYTVSRVTANDLEEMAKAGCELFVCAGYYYRLPVTDLFPMINFHPAPLPDCRGAWPMPQILMGAYKCGGLTAHRIASGFDVGDIIKRVDFDINENTTLEDYMNTVNSIIPDMICEITENLDKCLSSSKPQGEGRYLEMPTIEDYTVRFDMTVAEADKIMKAFYGYEIYYLAENGTKYELIKCRAKNNGKSDFTLKDGIITTEHQRII